MLWTIYFGGSDPGLFLGPMRRQVPLPEGKYSVGGQSPPKWKPYSSLDSLIWLGGQNQWYHFWGRCTLVGIGMFTGV